MLATRQHQELILEGYVPPGREKYYHHLPFEMPAAVRRLHVRYEYDGAVSGDPRVTGGNVVDIGIFDQRGIEFQNAGFRGWSGGARRNFFLTPECATPGYLAGPLDAGDWQICLGFYKVGPKGCHYRVVITLSNDGDTDGAQRPTPLPSASSKAGQRSGARGWFRGDLHCHTYHSDGQAAPAEMIASALARGLDFLAITDHNTISHLIEMSALATDGLVLIPGCEVTTYFGHWNVWGSDRWFDFRVGSGPEMTRVLKEAGRAGLLTSCNHPRPFGPPWEFDSEATDFHCIEVWNGPWRVAGRGPGRYPNLASLQFWEARLKAGRRYVAVGGSDIHSLSSERRAGLGTPTTWVYCPDQLSPRDLLCGLEAGHAFISSAPDGPQLYLAASGAIMGDRIPRPSHGRLAIVLRAIDARGLTLEIHTAAGCIEQLSVDEDDQDFDLVVPVDGSPYVRAQITEPGSASPMLEALTNPIYLD